MCYLQSDGAMPVYCSTVHRASVETLATRGSSDPFEYELPCVYSHLISPAGGVPDAISHLEGGWVHLLLPVQSQTAKSELHLLLPGMISARAPRSGRAVFQVVLWLQSGGSCSSSSWFLVLSTDLGMPARGLGLLVFLFGRCRDVALCKDSNSARNDRVKSQLHFENMCLWLTQHLIAQTFFFPDAEAARASAGKQLDYRSWELGRLPLCYKFHISSISTAEWH